MTTLSLERVLNLLADGVLAGLAILCATAICIFFIFRRRMTARMQPTTEKNTQAEGDNAWGESQPFLGDVGELKK